MLSAGRLDAVPDVHLTMLGTPAADAPWGWQVDGPRFVIAYLVAGDHVVITPTDLGAPATIVASGRP